MTEVQLTDDDFAAFEAHADRVKAIVATQTTHDRDTAWKLLPTTNGPRNWVLFAPTQNDQRLGIEIARAFVGPDIATFRPETARGNPSASEFQIAVDVMGKRGSDFLDAVELMLRVEATEPERTHAEATSLSACLRDFRLATNRTSVDRKSVEHLYERIVKTGQLSLENLRFLQVEMLAACGNWDDLVERDWFDELCRTRRPMSITHRLLEAVWRANFDDFQVGEDPTSASATFEARGLGERYTDLLRAVDNTTSTRGRRLLMLGALGAGELGRCDRILAHASEDERRWLTRLGTVDTPRPVDQLDDGESESITDAFDRRAWGTVIDLVTALDPIDVDNAQRIVTAAYELDDQEQYRRVADAIANIDLTTALEMRVFRDQYQRVTEAARDHCEGWLNWVRRAESQEWPQAFGAVAELADTWSLNEFQNPRLASEFGNLLLNAFDGPNRESLRQSLGKLCSLAERLLSEPSAEEAIFAILTVLADDENPSRQVLDAYITLLEGAFDSGPGTDRYDQLIDTGEQLWSQARSARNVDWLIELVETAVIWPCPTPTRRVRLVINAANDLRRFASAVPIEARSVFDDITREVDAGQLIEWPEVDDIEVQTIDIWARLAGRTVGLYSLVANIGARLEAKLLALCPTVALEVNDDTVNTAALQALARSADYMIVDWRHAAHAATGGIDAVRDRENQILPTGGGVSSFLSALKEALVAEGAVA